MPSAHSLKLTARTHNFHCQPRIHVYRVIIRVQLSPCPTPKTKVGVGDLKVCNGSTLCHGITEMRLQDLSMFVGLY